jgi:GDP-4-dehydro-6-deoxy-D-mannose reductase
MTNDKRTMPVWLVTGGTGFLGRHLLAALEAHKPSEVEVAVLGRRLPRDWGSRAFVATDLNDPACLERALANTAPAVVFHLAGQTPPAASDTYYRANTLATVHLLDALRARRQRVRIVLAGSAAELGPIAPEDLPVAEDHICGPADSYGLSKWLATTAGLAARPPLEVVVARIFNPIGPGLPHSQAFGRFAARLAEPGPDPLRLVVGDLDSRRDFIDVRDVALALLALAERGEAGAVYHVATGQSRRVGDGLDHLIRLSARNVHVEISPEVAPGRGPGPSDSRADIRRIVAATGWRPQVNWHRSLEDLWEATRNGMTAGGRFQQSGR